MFYGLVLPLSNCHFLSFSTKNFHLEISLVKSLSCGGGGGGVGRRWGEENSTSLYEHKV